MIPSFVKRLSSSLPFGKSLEQGNNDGENSTKEGNKAKRKEIEIVEETEEVAVLRRQSTHELNADGGEAGATRQSSRTLAVDSVRKATRLLTTKRVSKKVTTSTSLIHIDSSGSKRPEQRVSRKSSSNVNAQNMPAQLIGAKSSNEKNDTILSRKKSSATGSLRGKSLSKSLESGSTPLVRKTLSNNKVVASTRKSKAAGKELWFQRGSYLAVRTDSGFYLCRSRRNIFNFTKKAPINWLTWIFEDTEYSLYKIDYQDTIDPASIIMQVDLARTTRLEYALDHDQQQEIEKLLNLTLSVEKGNVKMDEVDDDVEEVIQIEEPPPKKPKLMKTASQKLREKAKRTKLKTKGPRTATDAQLATKKQPKQKAAKEPKRKRATPKNDLDLHPRNDIKVLEKDPLFETRASMPYISKVANSRLVYRAIYLKDNKMLTKLLKNGSLIYKLYDKSVDCSDSPWTEAVKVNDKDILQTIMQEYMGDKFACRVKNNEQERDSLYSLNTGSYNPRSLGIQFIRKITASRGSREGNNAFAKTEKKSNFRGQLFRREMDPALFKTMLSYMKSTKTTHHLHLRQFIDLLLTGQNEIASQILELCSYSQYDASKLIKDVLAFTTEDLTKCPPSAVKTVHKALEKVTAIHCAAVNPNSKYLKKLLDVQPDVHIVDVKGRSPIHYAACCKSTSTLQLLLDWEANPNCTDSKRMLPLHYAVKANRPKNVELLLKKAKDRLTTEADTGVNQWGVGGVNQPTNSSQTPLHIAAEQGFVEVAEVLLKYGANVNAKLNVSNNMVRPLMKAAAKGSLKMVQLLVSHGAVVEDKDRMGRTAVTYACMNGATSVLSYLLHIGADGTRADNSGNTPFHYAAAYGWYFTVELLAEAGVDPNAANMWRTTPVLLAFKKGHSGIVHHLLMLDKVDINFQDDDGATLLFHACNSDLSQTDLCEQIQYLIEEKGALCTLKDNKELTPLHHLAMAAFSNTCYEQQNEEAEKVAAFKQSIDIAKLLLKHGCDLNAVDKQNGSTALMIAMQQGTNFPLVEFLMKQGCQIHLPVSDDPTSTVLHHLAQNIGRNAHDVVKILDLLKEKNFTELFKDMARYVNSEGYTPLLSACDLYRSMPKNVTDDNAKQLEIDKEWNCKYNFILRLIEDFDSDLNAKVEKKFFAIDDMPKAGSQKWWHSIATAGKTAAHLLLIGKNVGQPHAKQLFKELVLRGSDTNTQDAFGKTMLGTCIDSCLTEYLDFLPKNGTDFNLPTSDRFNKVMLNPLVHACSRQCDGELISKLIDLGCEVNSILPKNKMNCLHILLSSNTDNCKNAALKILKKLSEKGFDFSSQDADKRTPLHYAVGTNKGTMNDSIEVEVKLIQINPDLSKTDVYGRTVLHYVFQQVKSDRWNSPKRNANPAGLAKLISQNMSEDEINHKDIMNQTALHYAAKTGSTMCCMLLLKAGANINAADIDGNTPLSLAVQNRHDGCAVTLIQSGADLKSPVVVLSSEEFEKRSLKFMKRANPTSDDDNSKDNDNDDVDAGYKKEMKPPKEVWEWNVLTHIKQKEAVETMPLFQAAVLYDLNGVTLFATEADAKKSDLTDFKAIRMALKIQSYQFAMRLLFAITDVKMLRQKNKNGRNLFHTLSLSCEGRYSRDDNEIILKIAHFLLECGIPVEEPDNFKCSALQYSILNRNFSLADFLAEKSGGYNVKYTDGFGRTYLGAVMWRCHSSPIDNATWDFIEKLIKLKLDVNKTIDLPLNPELANLETKKTKCDPNYWQRYPDHKTKALIAVICCDSLTISHNFLKWGADPNLPDGDKMTPLMHAIVQNKTDNVKQLLNYDYDPDEIKQTPTETKKPKKWKKAARSKMFYLKVSNDQEEDNESGDEEEEEDERKDKKEEEAPEFLTVKKTSSVNLRDKDEDDYTCLHYVAQPHSHGTFDNAEMAFVLIKAGAKLSKCSSGWTPYELALQTGAKKVAAVLKKHFKLPGQLKPEYNREFKVDDKVPKSLETWPDFREAAEKVLEQENSNMDVDEDPFVHEISSHCNIKGELVKDDDQDLFYDVLMTRVDVKHGRYGLYNFYQMQLVFQSSKSQYILFTRWGRITQDDGQFQHTPFTDKQSAVKEFMKIFSQKSGNKWTNVKNFEQKPKKYRLVEDSARKAPRPQSDVEIILESSCKSIIPKSVFNIIQTMMDPKKMQLSMEQVNAFDTTCLPFGNLDKERLIQGKKLLDQIEKLVTEVEEFQKPADLTDEEKAVQREAHEKNLEKIAELSNEYYHLIPQKEYEFENLRPLDQRRNLMHQVYAISNLLDYEIACKMLLAAMYYRKKYNPVDYVYHSLGCKMELMKEGDSMSQMILRYINLCGTKQYKIHGMYKLSREGEAERFQANDLGDRRLLWHGSKSCNLLSILNRGLLVALPEAAITGWAYGKGIYFSDGFSKSERYIDQTTTKFMLLCEVALGVVRDIREERIGEDGSQKFHNSVLAKGAKTFNPSSWFILPSGASLPQLPPQNQNYGNYSEYIVKDPAQVCLRYLVQFS